MTDFIANAKFALLLRYPRVFVVPYPYKKGHFRVSENGESRFFCLDDEVFQTAVRDWNELPVPTVTGGGDELLCAYTYARLMRECAHHAAVCAVSDQERLLLRLCMENESRYCASAALRLLASMYPLYKCQERELSILRGAALRLTTIYCEIDGKKLRICPNSV